MSIPSTPAYDALCQRHQRIHRLSHLQSIASWDQSAFMPARGAQARAEALAEMGGLLHQLGTDPALRQLLDDAAQEPLDDFQRASLREMRRVWRSANAVPQRLVEARSLANSHCEHQWRQQRPANDWAGYVENLRPVVRYAREEAQYLADDSGLSRYDALLDQYEPGMRSADIDRVFGDLRQWLPGLIRQVMARQTEDREELPCERWS